MTVAAVTAVALAVVGEVMTIAQRDLAVPVRPDSPDRLINDGSFLALRVVAALVFAVAGWYLATRRPGVIFGPLALAAALGNGLSVLGCQLVVFSRLGGHDLPGASLALWVASWGLAIEPLVFVVIDATFPDGEWPRGFLRWPAVLSVALVGAGLLHALVSAPPVDLAGPFAGLGHPFGLNVLPHLDDGVLIFPGLLLGSIVLVLRWLGAKGEQRLLLRTLAVISLVGYLPIGGSGSGALGPEVAGEVFVVLSLVAIVAGVLRRQVYGIEVVLNRALVYVVLTAVVAAVYAVLVGVVNLLGNDVTGTAGVLPAVAAAFVLFPARQRVQRGVNRFLYGQRDEPYAVVSGIAARLEGAGSVDRLLPELLASITESLRVPYAAVELRGDDGEMRTIASGTLTAETDGFALTHQGRSLGALVVGRRTGQSALDPSERVLLGDIARQAGVAVSNVMLTEELLRSRERIVNAAEEERRRLRRDLHDGLGPVLTAAATRVDAARNVLARDPGSADRLLEEIRRDLTAALDDLRRLVYALRPPSLDELGLVGALREHVRRSSVPVILKTPDALPALPPAVEVAAYRIVSEAVTNVCRHASASSCTVLIGYDGALSIDVSDDGRGGDAWAPGVGLTSMRERAVELGGRWWAGPAPEGGGRVHAEFPLPGVPR